MSKLDTSTWDDTKKNQAKKAAKEALKQFKDGIVVDGITRKVNKKSWNEYTRSDYTEKLYNKAPDVFADKMRAAEVADDIVVVATDWSRDGYLKHPRDDNFVDFDHGKALIAAGNAKYTAEVVVGITDTGEAVFYDVVDMTPATFDIKKEESPTTATTQNAIGDIQGNSFDPNVAQNAPGVKQQFSLTDTNGRQLTTEQQEYFKDSKARDDNGNLKLVYHSSLTAGFTVFDGTDGKGNYRFGEYGDEITFFTDSKAMADSYSPSTEKVDTKKLNTVSDARNWLDGLGFTEFEIRENHGRYDLVDPDEELVYDRIKYLAQENRRTVSNYLRVMIYNYLCRLESEHPEPDDWWVVR